MFGSQSDLYMKRTTVAIKFNSNPRLNANITKYIFTNQTKEKNINPLFALKYFTF